ncbi:MAG: phosphoesterase [Clostridia bacterium]
MKYCYDLHIHSALSPCCEDENTPISVLATASAVGLEIVAISDHNAIQNVKVAQKVGEMLDILVVPAIELQTNEDIHLLCLFETFEDLEIFYNSIEFCDIPNRADIFGNQFIYNDDDEVVGELPNMLLYASNISENEVRKIIDKYNGIAIPAHIDRDSNSMLDILGDIPSGYSTIEISSKASEDFIASWRDKFNIIIDSDAHTLNQIGSSRHFIDLEAKTTNCLIGKLRQKITLFKKF